MQRGWLQIFLKNGTIENVNVNFPRTMIKREMHEDIERYLNEEYGTSDWRSYNLVMEGDMYGI